MKTKTCCERASNRERDDHRPQFGPALLSGKSEPQRTQITADGLQLANDRTRVEDSVRAFDQLLESRERNRRSVTE